MSISATSWAWGQTMEPTLKLVLMAICDCHNAVTGRCDPSYEYIAQKACISRRTAIRAVRELADQEYIATASVKGDDGRQQNNTYVISGMADSGDAAECQVVTPRRVTNNRVTKTPLPSDSCVTRKEPEEPEYINNSAGAREAHGLIVHATPKRGTRLPQDFTPDASCAALARELAVPVANYPAMLAAFLDYWRAVPGAKGLKLDWQATFRNWLRNDQKFNRGSNAANQSAKHPGTIASSFAVVDALIAEQERRIVGGENGP